MKQKNIRQEIRSFIDLLDIIPPRDQYLLIKRIKEYKSMEQTAYELGIAKSRVQQIENRWIKKISQLFEFFI